MRHSGRWLAALLAVTVITGLAGRVVSAQALYPVGMFLTTVDGPVELGAFADRLTNGRMKLSRGTLEDVPAVSQVSSVICNVPTWQLVTVWVSSRDIFENDLAERRQLTFGTRPLGASAVQARVGRLDDAKELARLLRAVKASDTNPAYAFFTISNGGVTRDYVVELRPER